MLLDGLSWSHYSVFAPCIMTQTRVLGRSGGGISQYGLIIFGAQQGMVA